MFTSQLIGTTFHLVESNNHGHNWHAVQDTTMTRAEAFERAFILLAGTDRTGTVYADRIVVLDGTGETRWIFERAS